MTKEEAITILNQIRKILLNSNSWLESTHQPITEAFNMAIEALSQPKQKGIMYGYQPIGEPSAPPSPPSSGSNIYTFNFERGDEDEVN